MNRKKIIFIALAIALLGGGWYGYREYNREVKSLDKVKAQVHTTATDLLLAFEKDEAGANTLYLGKVIELAGTVRSVEGTDEQSGTIVLGEPGEMNSIRCSMDPGHLRDLEGVKEGTAVILKGACTGFNSDALLGSDVVLNRGVIVSRQDN